MTTTHQLHQWHAGDDWQINATLLDSAGAPFNIAGTPNIKWSLINEAGQKVLTEADGTVVVVDGPAGKCAIQVPAVKTSPLPAGRYTDQIRIVYGGITSTLAYGNNWVVASP